MPQGRLTCDIHEIEWDRSYGGPRCPLCVQEEITSLAFEEMDRAKKKLVAWRAYATAAIAYHTDQGPDKASHLQAMEVAKKNLIEMGEF